MDIDLLPPSVITSIHSPIPRQLNNLANAVRQIYLCLGFQRKCRQTKLIKQLFLNLFHGRELVSLNSKVNYAFFVFDV